MESPIFRVANALRRKFKIIKGYLRANTYYYKEVINQIDNATITDS